VSRVLLVTMLTLTGCAAGRFERRFSRSDGVDLPQLAGFALYSDDRALSVNLAPEVPGTLIEYRYARRYTDSRMATFEQTFEGA
jgi:hypothetical protein